MSSSRQISAAKDNFSIFKRVLEAFSEWLNEEVRTDRRAGSQQKSAKPNDNENGGKRDGEICFDFIPLPQKARPHEHNLVEEKRTRK